jgi:hypothetical protein
MTLPMADGSLTPCESLKSTLDVPTDVKVDGYPRIFFLFLDNLVSSICHKNLGANPGMGLYVDQNG